MKIIDCHTHSNNSPDGANSVSEMCKKAYELGLSAYCITDHCEANVYFDEHFNQTTANSFAQIHEEKKKYSDKMDIICGIELGQANQNFTVAEEIIANPLLDFCIGSIHNLTDFADFAFLDYPHENKSNLLKAYYNEILEICTWGKFDVLGHLTYPLRYMVGEQGFNIDMNPYTETIRECFKALIKNGKGIEINTSGLRQKYAKAMPDLFYVKLFKELGGEILTIGSDAHCINDIGRGFQNGIAIAKNAGFNKICYFKKRSPHFIKIS